MRVLVAMSGGVDSSVAAALLVREGHEVVGATMKLWGGVGDSGCCSVADVVDARRVADRLGIDHRVFNFTADFEQFVVDPYVQAHAAGKTPNPCVECNRHLKFDAFLSRALRLGFEAIATGHHARVRRGAAGEASLWRGVDASKDQSYVLSVLSAPQLSKVLLPIGALQKHEVRALAGELGLDVANKPDSQDVCFITSHTPGAGRGTFLAERVALHPGKAVDISGKVLGEIAAVELVTIGQRRGLGVSTNGEPLYALDVDIKARTVTLSGKDELDRDEVLLSERTWVSTPLPVGAAIEVQVSAHGAPVAGFVSSVGVKLAARLRRVAPGQIVALYCGDSVVGSGVAC